MSFQLLRPSAAFSIRRAENAMKKLRELCGNEGERQELLASGVAQHRVEALYPMGFAAYIPGMYKHFGAAGDNGIFDVRKAIELTSAQLSLFPKKVQEEITRNAGDFLLSEEYHKLQAELSVCFPVANELVQAQVATDHSLPVAAAYAFWMMEQRESLPNDGRSSAVHELFYQIYSYLIPELTN